MESEPGRMAGRRSPLLAAQKDDVLGEAGRKEEARLTRAMQRNPSRFKLPLPRIFGGSKTRTTSKSSGALLELKQAQTPPSRRSREARRRSTSVSHKDDDFDSVSSFPTSESQPLNLASMARSGAGGLRRVLSPRAKRPRDTAMSDDDVAFGERLSARGRRRQTESLTHAGDRVPRLLSEELKANAWKEQQRELLAKVKALDERLGGLKALEDRVSQQEAAAVAAREREEEMAARVTATEEELVRYKKEYKDLQERHIHLFAVFKKAMQSNAASNKQAGSSPRAPSVAQPIHLRKTTLTYRERNKKSRSMRQKENQKRTRRQEKGGSLGRGRFPALTVLAEPAQKKVVAKEQASPLPSPSLEILSSPSLERPDRPEAKGGKKSPTTDSSLPPLLSLDEAEADSGELVGERKQETRQVPVTFRYAIGPRALVPCSVQVAGSFNNWVPQSLSIQTGASLAKEKAASLGCKGVRQKVPRPTAASLWSLEEPEAVFLAPTACLKEESQLSAKGCSSGGGNSGVHYALSLALPSGCRHEYKFIVDRAWTVDESQPTCFDASGNRNNYIDLR